MTAKSEVTTEKIGLAGNNCSSVSRPHSFLRRVLSEQDDQSKRGGFLVLMEGGSHLEGL